MPTVNLPFFDGSKTPMQKRAASVDIRGIIEPDSAFGRACLLKCPICGCEYNHIMESEIVRSDDGEAWNNGRGDCIAVKNLRRFTPR